jgi:rSAM/selenodomain-associated transferase 1
VIRANLRPSIIVFAREPIAGQTKTRLAPMLGDSGAAAMADAFIRDVLRKARSLRPSKLVIAAATPTGIKRSSYFRKLARSHQAELLDQGEGTLGQRMARALERYLAPGAVLIGTDTPSLPASHLSRSLKLLRKASVVLGPSLDGGYYLVAVRDSLPDIFRGVRWGQSSVLRQTQERLRRRGVKFALGPWWYDVDRPADLFLLAQHLLTHPALRDCPNTKKLLKRIGLL